MPRTTLVKPIPVGSTFNRWTVIGDPQFEPCSKFNRHRVLKLPCRCICGVEKMIAPGTLREGTSKSCGCLQREAVSGPKLSRRKHGLGDHPLMNVWCAMKSRCEKPGSSGYSNYGGRGISVCCEWSEFKPFYDWAVKTWKKGLSLDRINNAGPYSPENCRFVTQAKNNRNKRTNRRIKFDGRWMCVTEFSELIKAGYQQVLKRARNTECGETIMRRLGDAMLPYTRPKYETYP